MKSVIRFALIGIVFVASCGRSPHGDVARRAQELASEAAVAMIANDFGKVRTLAVEATRLKPDFAEAWFAQGVACLRLGQADEARKAYERALALYRARYQENPTDAHHASQQIFLLSLLGKSAEAQAALDQARANHPGSQQIAILATNMSSIEEAWKTWGVEPR